MRLGGPQAGESRARSKRASTRRRRAPARTATLPMSSSMPIATGDSLNSTARPDACDQTQSAGDCHACVRAPRRAPDRGSWAHTGAGRRLAREATQRGRRELEALSGVGLVGAVASRGPGLRGRQRLPRGGRRGRLQARRVREHGDPHRLAGAPLTSTTNGVGSRSSSSSFASTNGVCSAGPSDWCTEPARTAC